jgi:hypothetical protein
MASWTRLAKPDAPRIVVLGVIFQHSPAVILVPSRAQITVLSDLKGHRLMDAPGSDDLAAISSAQASIYPDRLLVVNGGLVSYGADRTDLFRRAATHQALRLLNRPARSPNLSPNLRNGHSVHGAGFFNIS